MHLIYALILLNIFSVEFCADIEENPGLCPVSEGSLSEKSAVLLVFILFSLFYIDSIREVSVRSGTILHSYSIIPDHKILVKLVNKDIKHF